jgi:hypothetical protein
MNLAYWEEQIKATLVTAAHLAVPVTYPVTYTERVYLPALFRSYRGQEDLDQPNTMTPSFSRYQTLPEDP